MDESALLSALKTLDTSWSALEFWLWVSTSIVVAGVVIEVFVVVCEQRHDLREFRHGTIHSPEKPPTSQYFLELLGAALVALGVLGELLVGIAAGRIETKMRDTTGTLVASIGERAKTAEEHAESLRNENLKLQKEILMMGPRENLLTGETRHRFVDSLKPFAGQKFSARGITLIGGVNGISTGVAPKANEMDGLVRALISALKDAGWNPPNTSSGFQGQKQVASPATREAAKELSDAINKVPITGVSLEVEKDTIVLIVAPK